MRCPQCKKSIGISRVGNPLMRWLRRIIGRNLYVCDQCRTCWKSSEFHSAFPVVRSVRIHKKSK